MRYYTNYNPVILSAISIVAVNALAIVFCHIFNKPDAERYYKNFEPIKFHVMQFCYTILILSLSYNLRFLFMSGFKVAWRRFVKRKVRSMAPTLYDNIKRLVTPKK